MKNSLAAVLRIRKSWSKHVVTCSHKPTIKCERVGFQRGMECTSVTGEEEEAIYDDSGKT